MNRVKILNFNDTLVSEENPTILPIETADATLDTQAATLGQLKAYTEDIEGVAKTKAEIKAIAPASRENKELKYSTDLKSWFLFDSASSATADDITILQPDTGTGRWIRDDKVDLLNAQTIAGVKTFSSFPEKTGTASQLLSTTDNQLITKYHADQTFATAGETAGQAQGIHELQQNVTELAINQEYGEFKGENGLYTELFLNHNNEDKTIETTSNCLAEINGNLRAAPFIEQGLSDISDFFQNDRESSLTPKGGVVKPAYKHYYGETVDSWGLLKLGTTVRGIAWDSNRRCWWFVVASGTKVVRVSEDLQTTLGYWSVSGQNDLSSVCVDENTLYITDYLYSTYGRITKHTISTDGATVDSLASGNALPATSSVNGTASYHRTQDLTVDSTYIYTICATTNNIGKINKSTFSAWDSSISLTGFIVSGNARGIEFDGTDLFVSDPTVGFIQKIKIDGTVGYQKFSNIGNNLTIKDGDIFGVNSTSDLLNKVAIKNTRVLEGQIIGTYKNALSDIVYDAAFFTYGGNNYYVTVNGSSRQIRVYNESFVEVTSGTPQSTLVGEGSGLGTTAFMGVDCDGTYVYLSAEGSTSDAIYRINVTDLDGSYSLTTGDIKINFASTAANIRGITLVPSEANKIIYYRGSLLAVCKNDLVTPSETVLFEKPTIQVSSLFGLKFNPNNSRELYSVSAATTEPIVVIDYQMSKYMGDGNQPYIIKILGEVGYTSSCATFNAAGDLISSQYASATQIYKLAVASAIDHEVTGKGQRNIRYYTSAHNASSASRTYPAIAYADPATKKVIRYRRKYAASAYSNINNVLPLDGLYVISASSLSIIDLEANVEVMRFDRPETAANCNILDRTGGAVVSMQDFKIVNDMAIIGASVNMYVIDFVTGQAFAADDTSLCKYQFELKDRNLSSSSATTIWGSGINAALKLVNQNVISLDAKQDTTIKPEEHNGDLTTIDNGEIYVAYGTSAGNGVLKFRSGLSFAGSGLTYSHLVKITDDWKLVDVYRAYDATNGEIDIFGDIRKIYAANATVSWSTQTGYSAAWTNMVNRYVNAIDTKTIYRNGIAYNYILVGMGQNAVSDASALQIIDVVNNKIETVRNATTTGNYVGVCFGKENNIYAGFQFSGGGSAALNFASRVDFASAPFGSDTNMVFWSLSNISSTSSEYYQLADDIRNITFSHNTICIANDKGAMFIELPRQDSIYESETFAIEQPNKMFYIANDSSGLPTRTGKIRQRSIFSDNNDAKFTYTNGSSNNWNAVTSSATKFGGNYRDVLGQSAGGTQPKVSFTPASNCKDIIIYFYRDSGCGKIDVNYVDSVDGAKTFIQNMYSVEVVHQDQITLRASNTGYITSVELVCRSDKDSSSSNYNFYFTGHVECCETAYDRGNVAIKYYFSPDQDKVTKHFNQVLVEGTEQQITGQILFSGTGSQQNFQLPSTDLGADIALVEVYNGATWDVKTVDTDYTYDQPTSGLITTTFTTAPASGTNNIRITYVRQGTLGKIRVEFDYDVNATGLEDAYVNDLGLYLTKL